MRHIPATFALCLLAAPVAADPSASWGNGPFSSVTLAPPHGSEVLRIICRNELTSGHDTVQTVTVDIEGFAVNVIVTAYPFTDPDIYEAIVPEGYVAIPPRIMVREGEEGVILIFNIADSPMG